MPYNVHASIGKKKGKFIKTKVKRAIEAAKERLLRNADKENSNSASEHNLAGRRIVELATLGEQLWCTSCSLTLSLKNVESEKRCGFASILKVVCTQCGKLTTVHTNKLNAHNRCHDVNLKAAIAIIDAGIGETQMNTICSSLNIPSVSAPLLKRHERVVGPAIEAVAKESCKDGIKLEKQLTMNSDSGENTCRSDLQSREQCPIPNPDINDNILHTHDSESHSSLIGYHSGKVLSYCTRSKKCKQCDSGHQKEHQCRRNFSGSAKAMEPDMAVELVNRNELLKEENAKISVLIGDDDSCTIAAVRREAGEHIEKWSDFNHAHKALKNALYTMKLQPKLITDFSNCFSCAVKQNKGNPEDVEVSLKNVVPHAFGDHTDCGNWCNYKSLGDDFVHSNLPNGKPLSNPGLRETLTKLFNRFAANANKLAPCASSQANESFNSIVASKHPKSRFYAGTESFDTRVAAAVSQKNMGTKYIVDVNKVACLSPGIETKKFRERKDKKREEQASFRRSIGYKRRRLFAKRERSTKTAAVTRKEGVTYQTESGLSNVSDLIQNPSTSEHVDFDSCCTVVFDLETTGLSRASEICQIAACTENGLFNSYIIPAKGMTPGAAQVTGLRIANGEMYLKDVRLTTVPARAAFTDFLTFLKSQGQSVILVAHNGLRFDEPRILQLAADLGAIDEFMAVVKGFVDTLHVLRDKLPDRKANKRKFTQEALAADYIDSSNAQDAHNAINDVQVLLKILQAVGVEKSLLVKHTRSVLCVLKSDVTAKKNACNKASLGKLTEISDHMRTKISKAGIDEAILKRAFETGGDEGVFILLAEDIGGKPRVTKSRKIINQIVEHLKNA